MVRLRIFIASPARRPLDKAYRSLLSDIECVSWVNEAGAYSFNLPTHYLAWTLLLPIEGSAEVRGLCVSDLNYPMPRDRRAALRGACKLGLIELDGRQARLSDAGRAMRRLLPPSIESWAEVHRTLLAGGASTTLAQVSPPSAAGLSMLLLQDPVVRLVMNGLRGVGRDGVDFSGLARLCAAVDPRRAAIFFLKPEAAAARMRADGSVDWTRIESADHRSTTFFQYKSILKHAGLIAPTALGAASSKRYRPEQDRWAMFEPGA